MSLPYIYVGDKLKRAERLLEHELAQRKQEGYDVAEVEKNFLEGKAKTILEFEELLKELERATMSPDFKYSESSDLEKIKAERPKEPEKFEVVLSESDLYDKIYGGWLGRCGGNLLGKPVEGWSKERIEEYLRVANAYPLKNYFPPIAQIPEGAPEWLVKSAQALAKSKIVLGRIDGMVRDDDLDYTIIGLHILERFGLDFKTMHVGSAWLSVLPYREVHTAERVAYKNLVNEILPPDSAAYMNPYREWIGAQIRADMWGYVTPGMPERGAEFAYRDASLSHTKNGIYSEMFVSAMISGSFATKSINEIIQVGLSVIPKKSRLAEAVCDVVAWSKEYDNWEDAWRKMMDKYGRYHWVHTINNAAVVLLGLIYGRGDYERSIAISVMSGLDTDCNGATTGSILGVMLGAEALPDKWVNPLNDQLESFVIGFSKSQISDLAKRTLAIAIKC